MDKSIQRVWKETSKDGSGVAYAIYRNVVIEESKHKANNKIGGMSKLGHWLKQPRIKEIIKEIDEQFDLAEKRLWDGVSISEKSANYHVLKWQLLRHESKNINVDGKNMCLINTDWSPKVGVIHLTSGHNIPVDYDEYNDMYYLGVSEDTFNQYKDRIMLIINLYENNGDVTDSFIDNYKRVSKHDYLINPLTMRVVA